MIKDEEKTEGCLSFFILHSSARQERRSLRLVKAGKVEEHACRPNVAANGAFEEGGCLWPFTS
jgi:hypothetical protein